MADDERFIALCQAFDINDLDINILYEFALLFYKEKQGSRAIDLSYTDKLKLVALIKQARLGPFKQNLDIGLLDFIGNDRKRAWESLRNMTKDNAMIEFIERLVILCPSFAPFIKAQLATRKCNSKTGLGNPQKIIDFDYGESFNGQSTQHKNEFHLETYRRQELKETFLSQIRPMLQKLVEIQFPDDESKQKGFLKAIEERQLEQLFVGCTSHLLNFGIYSSEDLECNRKDKATNFSLHSDVRDSNLFDKQVTCMTSITDPNELPILELPSLWTKKCTNEFKESLKNDYQSIIEVGSGEIVTVRIPTHEGGSCLFWEFTTDYYDIGFGIFFEWLVKGFGKEDAINEENAILDDEANDDYFEIDSSNTRSNAERVDVPIEEVIQLNRVNSHEAVQCGSHIYHSLGVYLLKFDNSYSLWRSKRVYYRVFYTV